MKNWFKLICVAVFAALFIVFVSAAGSAPAKASASSEMAQSARQTYVNNCARCHGADGRGQTELGRLNEVPDISGGRARKMSSAAVTRLVTRGAGSMPGFGKKLTKKQIAAVVAYSRGL